MAYVSPTMRGTRQQAQAGLTSYAQSKGLPEIDWRRLQADIGDTGGDEITGDLYNKGIDWINKESESFLERQQRLQQPSGQQQPQTQQQQGNPWAQWGLDPMKDQAPNQTGTKEQAIAGLRYVASQIGVPADEATLNAAANAAGYSGSGPVTGEQYNKAKAYLYSLKSNSNLQSSTTTTPAGPAPKALPPHMLALQSKLPAFQRIVDPFADQVDSVVQGLLASGGSLSEDVRNQMKAQAKEDALSQFNAMRQNALLDLAGRGFSPDGGTAQAAELAAQGALFDALIRANRDLDVMAAQTNRADMERAVALADAIVGGRSGRNLSEFAAELQRFGAGLEIDKLLEDQRRFDSQYGLNAYIAENDAARQERQLSLQELLGKEGIALDRDRLSEQRRQFDTASKLDIARFLESIRQFDQTFGESQRQFNNQNALGWAGLNQQQQGRLLDYLMNLF